MTASVVRHQLGDPAGDLGPLGDLALQQAEADAQRGQRLPRLVVELAGDTSALALLRLHQAARERLHPPGRGLHLREEHRVLYRHRGLGRHRLGEANLLLAEGVGLHRGERDQPGNVAAGEQWHPHPAPLAQLPGRETPGGVGAQVGNQHGGAGVEDALHDRMVGGLEPRALLGRYRHHAAALEDRPDGEPRGLFDQHDAGVIERHQLAHPVEERHQHDLAVETAGELDGRLAQLLSQAPGAPLTLESEPSLGHVPRHGQNGERGGALPELGNDLAVEP